jgi:hypothetical protein
VLADGPGFRPEFVAEDVVSKDEHAHPCGEFKEFFDHLIYPINRIVDAA